MITTDQPTCFPDELLVRVSSIDDGTMLDRTRGTHVPDNVANRQKFCQEIGVDYDDVVYQKIVYDETQTYDVIREVGVADTRRHTSEVAADALITREKNVALMLPVADCVATVMYDPRQQTVAMLHLGRHSTVANLMRRAIATFTQNGSRPEDLIVWMSPSAHASHYVMNYFDHANAPEWQNFCQQKADGIHIDMQGYNAENCRQAGVQSENVHTSPINTVTSPNYFSHSAGDTTGRFVVVATLR